MFTIGAQLITESEFKRAMLAQRPIIVKYEDGEIADYGGAIEEITRIAVKVNGEYYSKASCRFFIR